MKNIFVKTKNVSGFVAVMDGLKIGTGEGRLGMVWGIAGRGKTRTAQWYAAHNACIYIRMQAIWKHSESGFLKALAQETGLKNIPFRKSDCFAEVINTLVGNPVPVFIDEVEKLPNQFLELIRDLTDITTAPVILIGEQELLSVMKKNRRVWSRVYQSMEFEPLSVNDVLIYAVESAGISLGDAADIFYRYSQGDFRLLRRNLLALVQILGTNGNGNGNGKTPVTPEMAKIACETGLTGR